MLITVAHVALAGGSVARSEPSRPDRPMVFANYYVWYHTGEHSRFPWAGWTREEAQENAAARAAQLPGEPPLSCAARPLIGPYDSADPVVAEWHVALAQAAGIDAFLVDWWEAFKGRDKNIDSGILPAVEKRGFKSPCSTSGRSTTTILSGTRKPSSEA